ncbi:hypothetical protein Lepto7376_0538 [[Leptolyngbya] sp. PCC 7376]|uniref:class I SAM-dependent methyltransferase n=1 Tax=[Leptolyngbya] sp. PCC 7376 TaxID=111781 RepID=UPI00029ECE14|nr:class I SAM-dependent methyltransferase [[Leptolyngbya] sp. PCC 7376]AFY36964.1 hypothetical protein Lepto7376_0538 [[Leptolyngbya] sp. PCC 7376]
MNDLEKYFRGNEGRLIDKWIHYFDIYDKHFSRFRSTDVYIVELGVYHGGSLQMWKNYFGPQAKVFGIDINPACKELEEDQVEIFIGDQEDRGFLRSLKEKIPKIDILLDDGGHTMKQQIATFEELFPLIDKNGVYLCEDMHTSYWWEYGGGYKKNDSFVEYSKNFIDKLNAWHSFDTRLGISDFTRAAHSLTYYDSVLVIEKRPIGKPVTLKTGVPSFPEAQLLESEDSSQEQAAKTIRDLHRQLQQSQSELRKSRSEVEQLQSESEENSIELMEMQKLLEQSHEVWGRSQVIIKAMESSKFWKLRKLWMKFKKIFVFK